MTDENNTPVSENNSTLPSTGPVACSSDELDVEEGGEVELTPVSDFPDGSGYAPDPGPTYNPDPITPVNTSPLGIPKLPAGTKLDLTLPEITVPNYPKFSMPPDLGIDASQIIATDPLKISQDEWMVIARRTDILFAYKMDESAGALDRGQADFAALDWIVPSTTEFFGKGHRGDIEQAVMYTEETASYVTNGIDKQSASLGCPFAAASFERERKEKTAKASHSKTVIMIGRWEYPRVILKLDQCTVISTRFTDAIVTALGCNTLEDIKTLDPISVTENQRAELAKVFQKYGVAVPTKVYLGGVLNYKSKEICEGTLDETEVETAIHVAAEAKYNGISAGAGCTFNWGNKGKRTAEQMQSMMTTTATGGNTLLVGSTAQWIPTVAPPENWAVITVKDLKPIIERLDPPIRDKLKLIWAYGQPAIGLPQKLDTPDRVLPELANSRFVLATKTAPTGSRGFINLACDKSVSPNVRNGAIGGEAGCHTHDPSHRWIYHACICLPVPSNHRCAFLAPDEDGKTNVNLTMIDTQLTFGDWKKLEPQKGKDDIYFQPESDGFVFCSIEAPSHGDRGHVLGYINQVIVAAASVHRGNNNNIRSGTICLPCAKGSGVGIVLQKSYGNPKIVAWFLPSTTQYWKFEAPQPLSLNQEVPTTTDGFVSVRMRALDARGYAKVYCGLEGSADHLRTGVAGAVHQHADSDQWIEWASLMLPVSKGFNIWSEAKATGGTPQFNGFWTAIVPNR